jgi:hypothetical protein
MGTSLRELFEPAPGTIYLDAATYGLPPRPTVEAMRQALAATVGLLQRHGKDVWLILQVPELDFALAECIGRPVSFAHRASGRCAVPARDALGRQATYRQIVADVQRQLPRLHVLDPARELCDAELCHAVAAGRLLYADSNHLSRAGALWLAPKFQFK